MTLAEARKLGLIPHSREEAIEKGVRWFLSDEPCVNGHVGERRLEKSKSGFKSKCIECGRERDRKRNDDPRRRKSARKSYAKHADKRRAEKREEYANDPEKFKERRIQQQKRPEYRAWRDAYNKRYHEDNREQLNENCRQRYKLNGKRYQATAKQKRLANIDEARAWNRAWYAANAEELCEKKRVDREQNPEHHKNIRRAYYTKNSKKLRNIQRKWHEDHPNWRKDQRKKKKAEDPNFMEKERERSRIWREENREHCAAREAKRRADKKNRTPSWLTEEDYEEIMAFYIEARELTEETGIQYEVDHIFPILGRTVSGLHVPWNLQILTKSENSAKNNKVFND